MVRKKQGDANAVEDMDCSFGCGDEITVWDRPMVTAWVAGRKVQATLDIGCSQMLLRADLIPHNLTEWCIHTDHYELGYVNMRVANRKGQMRVDFAPGLDREMIIGQYWLPLYDVLEDGKQAELELKGWSHPQMSNHL